MVELTTQLDAVFSSLSDPTRRDILKRVSRCNLTIGELAKPYPMSFAAIAKHVGVLEKACLITKHRNGKEQIISLSPKTITLATAYLSYYEKVWQERYDRLETLLHN